MNISVDVNGSSYEFQKIPINLSIVSPSSGIVISDNVDDMTKEYESLVNTSQQIIDSIDYFGSSIINEEQLLLFIKDTIDDDDASDETTFRRWIATMIGNGTPIDWDEIY